VSSVFWTLAILAETAREGTQAGGVKEGEAGFPPNREPDAGLNPRTPGS